MPINSNTNHDKTFINADQGTAYPLYDLTGGQQRQCKLIEQLNRMAPSLSADFAIAMRRLLNQSKLDVDFSRWQAGTAPQGLSHWLAAINGGQPDSSVLLGLDNLSLFAMSELFFGGDPSQLSEKQKQRPIADTERRLVNRVFNSLLAVTCPKLHLGLENWQSQWVDHADQGSNRIWCEIRLSGETWNINMHCGWPEILNGEPRSLPGVDSASLGERLAHNLEAVSVKLSVTLATLTLHLNELTELQQGDILPLNLDTIVTASAGGKPCLTGQICEQGDQLALRISEFIGDSQ